GRRWDWLVEPFSRVSNCAGGYVCSLRNPFMGANLCPNADPKENQQTPTREISRPSSDLASAPARGPWFSARKQPASGQPLDKIEHRNLAQVAIRVTLPVGCANHRVDGKDARGVRRPQLAPDPVLTRRDRL